MIWLICKPSALGLVAMMLLAYKYMIGEIAHVYATTITCMGYVHGRNSIVCNLNLHTEEDINRSRYTTKYP